MTDEEKRRWLADLLNCRPEDVFIANIQALGELVDRIEKDVRTETRAAILADEERRVWCEAYLWTRLSGWKEPSALRRGDRALAAWREARAAWEARDER